MKTKKLPKEVYVILIISFIKSLEFTGAILIPFFTDWGGLGQFEIQLLQAWFTLNVFLWEIPTGLIGDVKGLKYSVVVGQILYIVGLVVYAITPNIYMFLLGELLLAIAVAFNSGAEEALLYETMKDHNREDEYNKVNAMRGNLKLTGMLVASALSIPIVSMLELNQIFMLGGISQVISLTMVLFFVKEPKVSEEKELKPDYREKLKKAMEGLKDPFIRKAAVFITIGYGVAYFILWFYQPLLLNLGIPYEQLGVYRIVLIVAQILLMSVVVWLIDKFKKERKLINISLILLVAGGFLTAAIWKNIVGVLIFIVISGGIGLKFREIFSKTLNDRIESKQRATSLSSISMFGKLFLSVGNILFGYLSDINLNMTLGILGLILLIGGLIFVPKEN